jgi:tRNA uridine 5-carboxymethylaminomethyl modification enzyme
MQAFDEHFDVVVVGAGHAGCEAAMASACMGLKTALFTLNVDLIAQMSCNPAIGGIAKGHLVREVDALGGIMGEITDAVGIQFRLLNTSRGPAVWSPRAQCDKQAYRLRMREVLESQANLKIKQAEVADVVVENSIRGVLLRDGRRVSASAVIITTGTFLNGLIHCGEQQYPAGRSGEPAAVLLGEALKELGLRGCRLKTGTPPRLDGRTIDWSRFATRRCRVTSPLRPKRRTASFARTCIVRRCTAGRFNRPGRDIVRPSKTKSSSFPTSLRTSFFWSQRA